MKKLFLVITALLGIRANAIEPDQNPPSCEQNLLQQKSYNLKLKEIIFKSNSSVHSFSPVEEKFAN